MAGLTDKCIAGHYTFTIDGSDCGMTVDGIRISDQPNLDVISADTYGDSPLDAVYRGRSCTAEFQLVEWTVAGVAKLRNAFHSSAVPGNIGDTVGKLMVKHGIAKPMILTPAYAETGKPVITFSYVIPRGAFNWNLNNRLRPLPVSLIAFPDSNKNFYTEA